MTTLTIEKEAPNSDKTCKLSRLQMAAIAVLLTLFAAGWIAYWQLAAAVPLTEQDLRYATGLADVGVIALEPLHTLMSLMMLLLGVTLAFAKNRPVAGAAVLLVVSSWHVIGGKEDMVRNGIASGTIKIGCHLYESAECRKFLHLPVAGAPSRYDEHGQYADWAQERVRPVKSNVRAQLLPLLSFFLAPQNLQHVDELNARITAQRAEVEAFRAAHANDAATEAPCPVGPTQAAAAATVKG